MRKLESYRQDNNFTFGQLAEKLQLSRPYVQRLCQGPNIPSIKAAKAIRSATGGAVSVSDLMEPDDSTAKSGGVGIRVEKIGTKQAAQSAITRCKNVG